MPRQGGRFLTGSQIDKGDFEEPDRPFARGFGPKDRPVAEEPGEEGATKGSQPQEDDAATLPLLRQLGKNPRTFDHDTGPGLKDVHDLKGDGGFIGKG